MCEKHGSIHILRKAGSIPNYPTDIDYADMTGITDPDEKKRLLGRWKY